MALLLDTHVWIWTQEDPDRLGARTRRRVLDVAEPLHIATISTLEIARLIALGRIMLKGDLGDWVDRSIESLRAGSFELTHTVARGAYALPGTFHPDPADRILVATARHHGLTLVTADARILAYRHARTLDAAR